jgi:acetyl-CoA carboxylase biotin carboxylase subunit
MFQKILIANRGEIALRVIQACKELGINTVAVYSQADSDSLHVKLADEAICIGAPPSINSYLHIPSIISAAEITDVEAIHPGYGFLAENIHFAEICESCNIKFIGPTPDNIRDMGDKAVARQIAKRAGAPIVPGSDGPISDKEEALRLAKKIGYPVVIKAVAGGGGRGIRVAHNDIALANAFFTAQAEAEKAFANSRLYIEKYIEQPRHIEIQILADSKGNTIHLGERDCTIQRRHQKLLEESPSPVVDKKLRKEMGHVAVKIAKEIDYVNAGTIEFLMDKSGDFYFMEMNTRIQVEHPVTEMVTGVDIVKEQLQIASGEKLEYEQKDVEIRGWAIECRINAEDPANNFSPSPGKITKYHMPGGPGIRVDSHIYAGGFISPYYDSMLAKLIAYGRDRNEAIKRINRALSEYVIEGVKTTIPFHEMVVNNPRFHSGKYATDFIEHVM